MTRRMTKMKKNSKKKRSPKRRRKANLILNKKKKWSIKYLLSNLNVKVKAKVYFLLKLGRI